MPRDTFLYVSCGTFDAVRPMAAFAAPYRCAQCCDQAPWQVAAPAIAGAGPSAANVGRRRRHHAGCGAFASAPGKALRRRGTPQGERRKLVMDLVPSVDGMTPDDTQWTGASRNEGSASS